MGQDWFAQPRPKSSLLEISRRSSGVPPDAGRWSPVRHRQRGPSPALFTRAARAGTTLRRHELRRLAGNALGIRAVWVLKAASRAPSDARQAKWPMAAVSSWTKLEMTLRCRACQSFSRAANPWAPNAPQGRERPIIAATNRIKDLIAQGAFREDGLHRLNVIHLVAPPRERKDDIRSSSSTS